MIAFLIDKKESDEGSETDAYSHMMKFISNNTKNELSLLVDSKCDLEDRLIQKDFAVLKSLGLSTFVTVYCNPGGKFSMSYFNKTMKKLKISFATVLKLYNTLQAWRLESTKSLSSLQVIKEYSDERPQDVEAEILSPTESNLPNDSLLNDFNQDSTTETIEIVDELVDFSPNSESEVFAEV